MDTQRIKELIELMVENDLSRIEIQEGESHVLLKRGQSVVAGPLPPASLPPVPATTPTASVPTPGASAEAPPESNETLIRSPMVGTFYAASGPEAAPFVSVGSVVDPETVVCIVEAMKVFNEIKAEASGRITKVLVTNAEAVEYDQPLFAIEPA